MSTEGARVLVVDDHMVVRAGLSQVLREIGRFEVVGEADSGEMAVAECQRLTPDIVVMDVMMPGMGGRAATKAILQRAPTARVVALSAVANPRLRSELMEAGASAFLSKTISATELVDVIGRVLKGERLAGDDDGVSGAGTALGPVPGAGEATLGDQQRRVLALLTKGFTNPEIAAQMGISTPTARYHVSALLLKLGVSNRAEAAAWAIRNNLVLDTDI